MWDDTSHICVDKVDLKIKTTSKMNITFKKRVKVHLFGDKNSSARDAREMLVRSSDSFGLAWRKSLSVRNPNSFLMTGKYARSLTPATLCVFFKLAWTRLDSFGLIMAIWALFGSNITCLLYTSPSPRDLSTSRMPSSA